MPQKKRKKIVPVFTDYFNFSARERRGAIFLSILLLLNIGFLFYTRGRDEPFPSPDPELINALLEANAALDASRETAEIASVENSIALFPFDPNRMDSLLGDRIGLSRKQVAVISNFLGKGGRFRIKKDFQKMYCITEEQYIKLEPYLLLPDSFTYTPKFQKKREITLVDIGIADSIQLTDLRGIGPVLASRIVRYRQSLGGYTSVEQLREVWGVNDTLFEKLLPQIALKDTIPFRFVHLATDSFGALSAHPYIRGKLASLICNYRKQNGFSSIEELKKLPLVTEQNFRKLVPYLQAE